MDWVTDQNSCRLWAGPGLIFPFVKERFAGDIGYSIHQSYVLVDRYNQPVGFGQIMHRFNRLHLGRIIVNPLFRGQGFGRLLCKKLIDVGEKHYKGKLFSLNVCRHNQVARKLYESLGFVESTDQSMASDQNSIFMIRQPPIE
jgi:ribosomal protein S18 acetylase RimI-like enzyme